MLLVFSSTTLSQVHGHDSAKGAIKTKLGFWGYNILMYTVYETREFQAMAADVWDEATHFAFVDYIAQNPEAGDVIAGAGA